MWKVWKDALLKIRVGLGAGDKYLAVLNPDGELSSAAEVGESVAARTSFDERHDITQLRLCRLMIIHI